MKDDLLKKIKWLRKALLISGLLNIFFIFFLILWNREAGSPSIPVRERKAVQKPYIAEKSTQEILLLMGTKTIDELASHLTDKTLIENGFTMRDFALGYLITQQHFNFEKAISKIEKPKQRRKIAYNDQMNKKKEITVYSDAEDAHFEAAIVYLRDEKWPITPYGMYLKLLETKENPDPTLAYAFQCCKEFKNLNLLMRKAFVVATMSELLNLALEGPFDNLKTPLPSFDEEIREAKREFLLSYIDSGSETASELLLRSDFEFAVKKTDDRMALKLLSNLTKEIPQSRKFALALLLSPRGESIWEMASKKMYELAGETEPAILTRRATLARFAPVVLSKNETLPGAPKKEETLKDPVIQPKPIEKLGTSPILNKSKRAYIVQEGDTLWKVAKRYNADPIKIRELNDLQSNYLKPGTLIKLP